MQIHVHVPGVSPIVRLKELKDVSDFWDVIADFESRNSRADEMDARKEARYMAYFKLFDRLVFSGHTEGTF